jgi:hypothetical protein
VNTRQWITGAHDSYRRRLILQQDAQHLANLQVDDSMYALNMAVRGEGYRRQRAAMVLAYAGGTTGIDSIQTAPPQVLMAICEALKAHEVPSVMWVERVRQLVLGDDILAEVREAVADMIHYADTLPHRRFVPIQTDGVTRSGRSVFLPLFTEETKTTTRTERACGIEGHGIILEVCATYGRQVALSTVFVTGVAIIEHRVNGVLTRRTAENPATHGSPGRFGAVVRCGCCR